MSAVQSGKSRKAWVSMGEAELPACPNVPGSPWSFAIVEISVMVGTEGQPDITRPPQFHSGTADGPGTRRAAAPPLPRRSRAGCRAGTVPPGSGPWRTSPATVSLLSRIGSSRAGVDPYPSMVRNTPAATGTADDSGHVGAHGWHQGFHPPLCLPGPERLHRSGDPGLPLILGEEGGAWRSSCRPRSSPNPEIGCLHPATGRTIVACVRSSLDERLSWGVSVPSVIAREAG